MVDLKELRNRVGLTQQELADAVGVSVNTIQNWESGKVIPKGDNLNAYLDALKISDPTEKKRIVGELSVINEASSTEFVDNVPHFLFPEDSIEMKKIMNCYASAEELDMLGYYDYVNAYGLHAKRERRGDARFQLEFSFFEKYGGYNVTRKKIADAQNRLGDLYYETLEYAEENPGCEYRLASLDEAVVIEKIGKLLKRSNIKEQIMDIYDHLKVIEAVGTNVTGNNFQTMMRLSTQINAQLKNVNPSTGKRDLGLLEGYASLEIDNPRAEANIGMLRWTERGKQLVEWVEAQNKKDKTVV